MYRTLSATVPTSLMGYTKAPLASVSTSGGFDRSSAASRGPRAISAGFHQSASEPTAAATASPIAIDRAPIGSRKSGAPSGRFVSCACIARLAPSSSRPPMTKPNVLEGRRLIDQHDGDAVAHGVFQLARVTDERGLVLPVLQLPFAFWTHQDGQQLRGHGHRDR